MVRFVCTNCNYRFDSRNPSDCPYCNKNMIEKEKNAEELLDEIEGLLNE